MNTRTLGLAAIVIAAITAVAAWTIVSPAPAHAGGVPGSGDADCSGVTDSHDALLILQSDAGLLESSVPCREAAEVKPDGRIDAQDAALILHFTAGLLKTLPPLPQPASVLVIDAASAALLVPTRFLHIAAVETATWPDSCLGLAGPEELCLQVITFGWRVTVEGSGDHGGVWHVDTGFGVARLAELY